MKKNILILMCISLFLVPAFLSCERNDGDYSKYLDKAEAVHPGKPDSMEILPGYNRGKISSLISPDPRVVKIRIYWNSRRDSIDAAISAADLSKYKIVDLGAIPEGVYTFEAATFDAEGHRSVIEEKTGSILGPNYIKNLVNRVIKSKVTISGDPALIWYSETDTTSVMAGVQVIYPLISGDSARVFTKLEKDTTLLTGAKPGGTVAMRTAYLPKGAIDTFYTKPENISY